MKRSLTHSLLALSVLSAVPYAAATPYAEVGDAGHSLITAQSVVNGTTSISGALGTGDAVDIYRFSWVGGILQARTSSNFDPMLFMFNLAGDLLAFNDDYPRCCEALINPNLASGDYLLAIDNYSYNYGGNLAGFAGAPGLNGGGTYVISLSAPVNGREVPEPVTLALIGFGLVGIAASRRRKH